MYKYKIDMLMQMIKDNEIQSCSIIGKPTKELCNSYFKLEDLTILYDKYNIKYEVDNFDDASVRVHFHNYKNDFNNDVCMISIDNPTQSQVFLIINNLLENVIDCTQRSLLPSFFAKIVGTSLGKLTFSDMLFLIPEKTQASVCEKIGRSPQALSDIKSGKNNLTIEILSKLMNLYPLLPWEHFIKDITKN